MPLTPIPIKFNHSTLLSSRTYKRLLENQKPGNSKERFLPKIFCPNSSTNIFPKKHADFGGLETNGRHEIKT